MARGISKVVGRVALGLLVGLTLGAVFWAAVLTLQGHNVAEALRGQVEDALGSLEALVALGGLCGAGVGLCGGLAAMAKSRAEPGAEGNGDRDAGF